MIKIRDSIRSITKNFDYEEKFIKIKFNLYAGHLNSSLPLNETAEISTIAKVVRDVFLKDNKYYSYVVLDEYLYKI